MSVYAILSTSDPLLSAQLPPLLEGHGISCLDIRGLDRLWSELGRKAYDLVVIDHRHMGPEPGETLAQLQRLPEMPEVVVLLGAEDSLRRAALLAGGAFAVLSRETPLPQLGKVLAALALRASNVHRQGALETSGASADDLVVADVMTKSNRMAEFLDTVRRVAASDSSLLIQGETGTGKEYIAKAIHNSSLRRGGPFVPVHCAALSETLLESELFGHVEGAFTGAARYRRGYFELAHGGTVFLDEVGELSPSLQVKILRVLQERVVQPVGGEEALQVDVRLMAATHRNLALEVDRERFRSDLYYRLSVVTLQVPPLRERVEDIPQLVNDLVEHGREARRRGISGVSEEAMSVLCSYEWPGNVRELMNVLERAALLARSETIGVAELPARAESNNSSARDVLIPWRSDSDEAFGVLRDRVIAAFEAAYFRELLIQCGGRLESAAHRAALNPRSLYEKMRRHGLRKEDFR